MTDANWFVTPRHQATATDSLPTADDVRSRLAPAKKETVVSADSWELL